MAILLQDAFTGTDGTNLNAHTMNVGSGWTNQEGSMVIQSNKAVGSTYGVSSNAAEITADSGQADADYSVDIKTATTLQFNASLIFNYVDLSNYWLANIGGSAGGGDGQLVLYENSSGSFTDRGHSTAGSMANNTTYTVLVKTACDTVLVYLNGVLTLTYTVASRPSKTGTKCGMRPASGVFDNGSTFDNFLQVDSSQPTTKRWGGVPHGASLQGAHGNPANQAW